jgi:hypothetical protein
MKKTKCNKIAKRAASAVTAMVMLSGLLPLQELPRGIKLFNIKNVVAEDEYVPDIDPPISYYQNLVGYSKACNRYAQKHQNDTINIEIKGDSSDALVGFESIGTAEYPFAGKVVINSLSAYNFNLDTAFFDYVYDHVEVVVQDGTGGARVFTIHTQDDNPDGAVFANHVLHDDRTNITYNPAVSDADPSKTLVSPAEWKIQINDSYPNEDNYDTSSPHSHSSLIGEMGEDAELTVSIVNDSTSSFSAATGNVGTICGTMERNSKLTVASVKGTNTGNVTATAGNAGGLVGEMKSGSELTVQDLPSTASITAGQYAGGLVGKNDSATVTISGTPPSISNTVSGTSGAGGLLGYYKPIMTSDAYSLTIDDFTIGSSSSWCTVKSTGGAGGFFGVLDNPGGTITLSGNSDKTVYAKGDGANTIFGGIIGKYQATGISDTLKIQGTAAQPAQGENPAVAASPITVNTTRASSNLNVEAYGGVIGKIDGACFASITDVDVTAASSDDWTFGGTVGIADTGYTYVKNFKLNTSNSEAHGGGVVGSCTSGVVHLSGSTDISNAKFEAGNSSYGQIVGYRDSALVFADSSWNLTRNGSANTVDDIGSWGEVVRFKESGFTIESVLDNYYDPSSYPTTHYAKLKGASFDNSNPTKISIGSKSTFATAALNMQLNGGSSSATNALQFTDTTNSTYTALKSKNIVLTADVNLQHTGMTGLTRDNKNDSWTIGPEYSGTEINADYTENGTHKQHKLTLAIGEYYEGNDSTTNTDSAGKGMIYTHRYNGLFGETSSAFTAKNIIISGEVYTYDRAGETAYYEGTVAGNAAASFSAQNVTVDNSTKIKYATNSDKDTLYVGGLVGKMSAPSTSTIGSTIYSDTTDSTFSAKISGSAASGTIYVGGVCGYVGSGGTINVNDVKITNEVSNAGTRATQQLGGLFGVIEDGTNTLRLNGVELNGLTVKGKMSSSGSMGGLLGYSWNGVTATFDHINVLNCTLNNDSSTGNMAGLVYTGSGYWKFNSVEIGSHTDADGDTPEVNVNGITMSGSAADSLGMLVNKAYSSSKAMYLELPTGYTYKIYNVTAGNAPTLYDEIAVYTAMPNNAIEANGNSIISINTNGTTKYGSQTDTKVNTSGSCNTYQNQVTGFNTFNPNSRYYYNLDKYKDKSSLNAAENLFLYSVKKYAHSTISDKFTATTSATFADGTGTDTLDLDGYSYYPFDVDANDIINLSGTVKLHNSEIETNESASSGGSDLLERTSLKKSRTVGEDTIEYTTQHYLMHAGLFRNVNGTININGALSLNGTVPDTGDYCGAIICGTIGGDSNADAVISSNNTGASISLNGIKVYNKDSKYSPLLINQASGYVQMDIYHVSAVAAKYTAAEQIATSLIGNVGSNTAAEVKVTFNDIMLDARSANTPTDHDTVYGTKQSLFTRATLLESLTYASGSGSKGVYNYTYSEDWNDSHNHVGNVTYGKELTNTASKNYGKEFWYYNENHSSSDAHYVDPLNYNTTGNGTSTVSFTAYLPYVAIWGSEIGTSTTKHQLNVNHAASTFSGCGTYNDPYIITDDDELLSIAKILKNDHDNSQNFQIFYPNTTDKWCDNKTNHKAYRYYYKDFTTNEGTTVTVTTGTYYQLAEFTENGEKVYKPTNASVENTIDPGVIRDYVAGAYYYIANDITISDIQFSGLGEVTAFHGVIEGDNNTITNETKAPIIYASNGCVIRNLKIEVNNDAIDLTAGTITGDFLTSGGCDTYGAFIGRVFGGDNILDAVKVDVSGATVTPATLTPVGGYIGVIVEGGVIFRKMDSSHVTAAEKAGFATSNNNVATIYAESNKQYLYCNPLIGRVINGFAVTEASEYAPYEDEYRYFGSGSKIDGNAVTLKNGNKNYSITDIVVPSSDSDKLNVTNKSFDINSSQQFFVMSLIINSGIGTNGTNVVGYYGSNQMTRHADYSNVGTEVKKTDAGYTNTDAWKDYQKAVTDNTTNPYLLDKYAKGTYAKQLGSSSDFTINLKTDIVLPDGYKGIGNIYGTKAIINTTNNTEARLINDNLQLALSNFYGNDHTISQNTTYYSYTKGNDNYLPYTHYSYVQNGTTKYNNNVHGLGLFNYVKNATYKECILTGNVKTRQYNTDGTAPNYIRSDDFTALAAGMFIGTLNMGNNATITDVYLQNTYTEGSREAAGLIGFLINTTDKRKISITNTTDKATHSNKIYVSAGTSAAGLIARQGSIFAGPSDGMGEIEIKFNEHYFNFVSIVSRFNGELDTENGHKNWNQDWSIGVGGLIGITRSGTEKTTYLKNHITIDKVNIGKSEGDTPRVVACEYTNSSNQIVQGPVYCGGLVGVANKAPIDATDCNIYNVTVRSQTYSGGVLGWGGTWSNIDLERFTIKNTLTGDDVSKIISSSTGNAGCVVGFSKGGDENNSMGSMKINDSVIDGYTIEAGYAGAALGDWQSSKPFSINNSIVNNCTINYYTAGGGLAGQLKQSLNGYNVRVNNITFTKKGNSNNKGYIAGKRDGGTIKIVGFQRTGTISEAKLIGNNTNNVMSDLYGSTGYVVFADYEGTSALDPQSNTAASAINNTNNVTAASPYITVNPALSPHLEADIGLLTGDGISKKAVNSILTDATNKKYQVKASSSADPPRSYFLSGPSVDTNTVSDFTTELGASISGKSYNFPLLVIDDPTPATVEADVNNYLQMLTNTTIDFSNSGNSLKVNSNAASTDIGTVTIYKCAYSNGTYTLTDSDACLTVGDLFGVRQSDGNNQYDTANPNGQFTLIDVAFKDPSDTTHTKVAYHLYVPVLVKKLLEYNFDISVLSGTTYDTTKYSNKRGYALVENLGAPVTFEFEYEYLRDRTAWDSEDSNYNYDKILKINLIGGSDVLSRNDIKTKAMLIDLNRGGKAYYLNDWSDAFDSTTQELDLQLFEDVEGNMFSPMDFNDLITTQGITAENQEHIKERYYLTIFTESYDRSENDTSEVLAHYTVQSKTFTDSAHPSRRLDRSGQSQQRKPNIVDLYIGDFYTNNLTVTTNTSQPKMYANNKEISVTLSSTISFVSTTTGNTIGPYLDQNDIYLYQSFLLYFEKYENGTPGEQGISAIDACSHSITINNGNTPLEDEECIISRSHIELQNNTDISKALAAGSVTISANAVMEFNDEETRNLQFPKWSETGDANTGSLVWGASNISSQKENTAYSAVSKADDDVHGTLYYRTSDDSAKLNYYADYDIGTVVPDPNNPQLERNLQLERDSQLGVNGREVEFDTVNNVSSKIYTEARYDVSLLPNAKDIKYIHCVIELEQKNDPNNPEKYNAVSIGNYLSNLEVNSSTTYTSSNNDKRREYVFSVENNGVPKFLNETDVYRIPIEFNVKTGKNSVTNQISSFEDQDDYAYANYKIKLTVSAYDSEHNHIDKSTPDSDYVIYTNARINTELIK